MLLVGRHSVTRSDMVVIKKLKRKRQRKLRDGFRVSSFAGKRETEGKTPRITLTKKAISNMKQRNKIPGLPSSVLILNV